MLTLKDTKTVSMGKDSVGLIMSYDLGLQRTTVQSLLPSQVELLSKAISCTSEPL